MADIRTVTIHKPEKVFWLLLWIHRMKEKFQKGRMDDEKNYRIYTFFG